MGAETFRHKSSGKTAQEAFRSAVDQAAWDHGHSGYTGTIAEKHEFVMISFEIGDNPQDNEERAEAMAEYMIYKGDPRIQNKWGPAGCIQYGKEDFFFFGWASS